MYEPKGCKIQHFHDFPDKRRDGQKNFEGNSEGFKVLKKVVKYISFVIFVKNERSVGRNSSEIERANKESKSK